MCITIFYQKQGVWGTYIKHMIYREIELNEHRQ